MSAAEYLTPEQAAALRRIYQAAVKVDELWSEGKWPCDSCWSDEHTEILAALQGAIADYEKRCQEEMDV